jgi:hypothetical protein
MVTIADFIGTWYLGGDRTKPCHISLDGTHLAVSIGGTNYQGYSSMATMRFIVGVIRKEY